MSNIKPFRAIRPNPDVASQVAALPYDVYSSKEARDAVKNRPLSFLNIDRPETQFDASVDMYSSQVYQRANSMIEEWVKNGIFIQDQQEYYYIYELTMLGRSQTGIVGLTSIDDYLNNICKKHENTIAQKELDRIHHVDTCSAQTGPIFLAYRKSETINSIVDRIKLGNPIYDFETEDGVLHRVWVISDTSDIASLEESFKKVKNTYIADGHHRAASAIKVGLKRREQYPDYTGEEEFNYFLSVLFPDSELAILDYNRFVKDLRGYSQESFLNVLSKKFDVSIVDEISSPNKKGTVHMYLGNTWYKLDFKEDMIDKYKDSIVDSLDVSILQKEILTPLLGIQDPRTDSRIEFIGGIRGLDALEQKVDASEDGVAFAMYPTSIEELLEVADADLLMPPKSTWFEPKLRSGLFIHQIER